MFQLNLLDPQHALAKSRRMICHLCGLGFDSENGSAICPGCIAREPGPLQDNSPWIDPCEPAAVAVARFRQIEAELKAHRFFMAALYLHQVVTSIAGSPDRPLRLLPKDQHKMARAALELFAENFPDMMELMDLKSFIESGTLWPKRGLE